MDTPLEMTIDQALEREGATWIDVRERDEWSDGHIAGTQLHPLSEGIEPIVAQHADLDAVINVSCAAGGRSMRVVEALRGLGYTHVTNVAGGFNAWRAQGRDFVTGA